MALRFDPATLQYVDEPFGYDPEVGTLGPAWQQGLGVQAGSVIGDMTAPGQYGVATSQMFPGLQDRPYLSRFAQRAYEPLYGQYLTGYGGFRPDEGDDDPSRAGAGTPIPTFAQFVKRGMGTTGTSPFEALGAGPTGVPQNWSDIVNVARYMGTGGGGTLGEGGVPTAETFDRWADVLRDPKQAQALISYATYDPRAGGIFGRLRQQGLARQQRRWAEQRPGIASLAGWLGNITQGDGGYVRSPFTVPMPGVPQTPADPYVAPSVDDLPRAGALDPGSNVGSISSPYDPSPVDDPVRAGGVDPPWFYDPYFDPPTAGTPGNPISAPPTVAPQPLTPPRGVPPGYMVNPDPGDYSRGYSQTTRWIPPFIPIPGSGMPRWENWDTYDASLEPQYVPPPVDDPLRAGIPALPPEPGDPISAPPVVDPWASQPGIGAVDPYYGALGGMQPGTFPQLGPGEKMNPEYAAILARMGMIPSFNLV